VVGDAAAAVDVVDLDALAAVPVVAHRQVGRQGSPPARIDGRVLEKQERVRDLAGLAARSDLFLESQAVGVGNASQLRDPELSHHVRWYSR
jgi:hypothetical protein